MGDIERDLTTLARTSVLVMKAMNLLLNAKNEALNMREKSRIYLWRRGYMRLLIRLLVAYEQTRTVLPNEICHGLPFMIKQLLNVDDEENPQIWNNLRFSLALVVFGLVHSNPPQQKLNLIAFNRLWEICKDGCATLFIPPGNVFRNAMKCLGNALGKEETDSLRDKYLLLSSVYLSMARRAYYRDENNFDDELNALHADKDFTTDGTNKSFGARSINVIEVLQQQDDDESWGLERWWHGIGIHEARKWERVGNEWKSFSLSSSNSTKPSW